MTNSLFVGNSSFVIYFRFSVPYFREITSNAPELLNDLFQLNKESSFNGMCVVAKEKIEKAESEPAAKIPTTPMSTRRKSPLLRPRNNDLSLIGFVNQNLWTLA